MNKPEKIVCAACLVTIKYPDHCERYVALGVRHFDGIMNASIRKAINVTDKNNNLPYIDKSETIQGFSTSKRRFVDREEAYKIALAAKQIQSEEGESELFSEDLY